MPIATVKQTDPIMNDMFVERVMMYPTCPSSLRGLKVQQEIIEAATKRSEPMRYRRAMKRGMGIANLRMLVGGVVGCRRVA